jgi:WD40 repeat protein
LKEAAKEKMSSSGNSGSASTITTNLLEVPKEYMISIISQFLLENQIPIDDVIHEMVEQDRLKSINGDTFRDSAETALQEIIENTRTGRWDLVLERLSVISVSSTMEFKTLVSDIYEHIIKSLAQVGLSDLCKDLLEKSPVLNGFLKRTDPSKYGMLVKIVDKIIPAFSHSDDEERARINLASRLENFLRRDRISNQTKTVSKHLATSGLIRLVQDAMKWRKLSGGGKVRQLEWLANDGDAKRQDFSGHDERKKSKSSSSILDIDFSKPYGIYAKFGKGIAVESCAVNARGQTIATGTSDGFVELWNAKTVKSRKDLSYQANEEPIFVDSAVISITFSLSDEFVACGDVSGKVHVFRIAEGTRVHLIDTGHSRGGVGELCFSPDETKIVTAGSEGPVRIFSLSSGARLCDCIGHESFVNSIAFISATRLLTGSSDEKVILWNANNGERLKVLSGHRGKVCRVIPFKPVSPSNVATGEIDIPSYLKFGETTHAYVCYGDRISILQFDTFQANITIISRGSDEFIDLSVSGSGQILFAACADGSLWIHDRSSSGTRTIDKETLSKAVQAKSHLILREVFAHPDDEMTLTICWSTAVATFSI